MNRRFPITGTLHPSENRYKVECERRYSWSGGDRRERGCRLARIRRQPYRIVLWLEQRRICITRDEAADDRLTMDLREEYRQVGGFPNIRVMEIADLSLERSSLYEDDGLRKHVALRHELSGDGVGSLALGGGPIWTKMRGALSPPAAALNTGTGRGRSSVCPLGCSRAPSPELMPWFTHAWDKFNGAAGSPGSGAAERRCVDATHPVCERDSAGLLQVANRSRPSCIES